jgi:hypothetical protein
LILTKGGYRLFLGADFSDNFVDDLKGRGCALNDPSTFEIRIGENSWRPRSVGRRDG